jgi:glycosyltransferase involved in cell wall biosynthesis
MNKISLAIPTYFSSKYLSILLKSIKNSELISEIIISDDSNNMHETENIKKIIGKYKNSHINFVYSQNLKNQGAFNNKYDAIAKCSNQIVYQIDSDNIIAKNFDMIVSKIIDNFDPNRIYYPAILKQFFYNYQYYFLPEKNIVRLSLDDRDINSFDVSTSIKNNEKITIDKNIYWILNCGNFIVSKNKYLEVMQPYYKNDSVPLAADALAISYLWLKSGKSILLSKNLYHFHRKRKDSVSLALVDESKLSFDYFKEKFKSL